MADSRYGGGKFVFVFTLSLLYFDLVFFPCIVLGSNSIEKIGSTDNETVNVVEYGGGDRDAVLMHKQLLQLEKLEELVKNLTQIVAKFESQFNQGSLEVDRGVSSSGDEIRALEEVKKVENPSGKSKVELGATLVTKYSTFWSEMFQFGSMLKLGANPSSVTLLPFMDFDGVSKFFAVGDDNGRLYVFRRTGDVAMEFDTEGLSEEGSPVVSMVSYLSVYKNESMIVTGHENGVIVMHRVWEASSGDEWSSLHVERVGRFETLESGGSLRIDLLEVHFVGRRRYILAVNGDGCIVVFREDRRIHGVVRPNRRPVVFLKQRLLFLTETGAGSLDLRTMKLKESKCEGLNGSFAISYVFDVMDRTKVYGLTSDGNFIHTMLVGDAINLKCRVRFKKKLDMDDKPLALHAIKGYLLMANQTKVFVYNVTTPHYARFGVIRLLFSASLDEIIPSFLNQHADNDRSMSTWVKPLITSDHEKHVVISLGNGYVATFHSNLPVIKSEFNSIWWTSPVLFFVLFIFVVWHFFANKKDALTLWDPDVSFSPTAVEGNGSLIDTSRNDRPLMDHSRKDRSLMDPSRNSDTMDLRGSAGLRSSSRYASSTQYPGGASSSYGPSPEMDARPVPVDPRFGLSSELKFRGSNADPVGIPKRRDMLFINNTAVDDST